MQTSATRSEFILLCLVVQTSNAPFETDQYTQSCDQNSDSSATAFPISSSTIQQTTTSADVQNVNQRQFQQGA